MVLVLSTLFLNPDLMWLHLCFKDFFNNEMKVSFNSIWFNWHRGIANEF